MPVELEPPELARLVDFTECPRTHDWSLRSALVRYALPEPQRVSELLNVTRRVEWALGQHKKLLAKQGRALWDALDGGAAPHDDEAKLVVGIMRVAQYLDELADVVAAWAVDPEVGTDPGDDIDEAIEGATAQLDALGIGHEERPEPPRRGRG